MTRNNIKELSKNKDENEIIQKQIDKEIKKETKLLYFIWAIIILVFWVLSYLILPNYIKQEKETNQIKTISQKYKCDEIQPVLNKKTNIQNTPYLCYIKNDKLNQKYKKKWFNFLLDKNKVKDKDNTYITYNKNRLLFLEKIIDYALIKTFYYNKKNYETINKYTKQRKKILKDLNNSKTLTKMFYKNPKDFKYFLDLYYIYWNRNIDDKNKMFLLLRKFITFQNWKFKFKTFDIKNEKLKKIQNENIELFKKLLKKDDQKEYKKFLIKNTNKNTNKKQQ